MKNKFLKDLKYKFEFALMMGFVKILLLFPEKSRFKFAESLAKLGYKLIKKRKEIALANLKLAFPEKSQEERERIALESYKIMAKAFLSSIWFDTYLKKDGNVKVKNMHIIDNAMAQDKGVIAATMHMGNMEASLKVAEKYHMTTVAKKQRNPYLDEYITKNREKLNITLIKKSKRTSRELMESIHRKDIIALFSDHRDKGATIKFFGRETIAPTGAIFLALKYDLPFVLG
jgi:KDO2-lipid IV(A) lauroyltransferase